MVEFAILKAPQILNAVRHVPTEADAGSDGEEGEEAAETKVQTKQHFVEQRLYVRNHAKCFTHLVFCDCGFHSFCPLREKDQKLIEKKREKEKIAHLIEHVV